jgi:hypothetical protein
MDKSEKKIVPPYLSYRTFTNFLDGLKKGVPARIDRSILSSLSGANQSALLGTLQYLGLISENGIPKNELGKLVRASGPDRNALLDQIMRSAYSFVFADGLKLEDATPRMIEERFSKQNISGGTIQKCIAFFVSMAKDSGAKISHHMSTRKPPVRGTRSRRSRSVQSGHENGSPPESDLRDFPPAEGMVEFRLPIPGKRDGIIRLPDNLDGDDWEMLKIQLDAYVKRLIKQEEEQS